MPKFYINFRNGDQIAKDDEGQDFPGLEEAEAAALVAARELLADNIKSYDHFCNDILPSPRP